MMFIVERGTRRVLHSEPFTPQQREKAWEYLIRSQADRLIREEMKQQEQEATNNAS